MSDEAAERRDRLFGSIRQSLGRGPLSADAARELDGRIERHERSLQPARSQGDRETLVRRFVEMAEAVACSVRPLDDAAGVPEAVVDYLRQNNLPLEAVLSPDPALADLPWDEQPLLTVRDGVPVNEDLVSVTPAFGAVAETGTLVMASDEAHPATLNFLPDHHVVVLRRSQIAGGYEDVWDRLRAARGPQRMPRTVNLITGPSRTGDIELQIHLGAHGPRSLHILLIDDEESAAET